MSVRPAIVSRPLIDAFYECREERTECPLRMQPSQNWRDFQVCQFLLRHPLGWVNAAFQHPFPLAFERGPSTLNGYRIEIAIANQ